MKKLHLKLSVNKLKLLMKKLSFLLSGALLTGFLALMGCGGDDDGNELTIEDQQKAALAGSWSVSNDSDVTLDDDNAPGDWSAFTITFTDGNATVSGEPTDEDVPIWGVEGYTVSGENATDFTINFGPDAVYAQVSESTLNLTIPSLEEGGTIGSKTSSVEGVWVFSLSKIP